MVQQDTSPVIFFILGFMASGKSTWGSKLGEDQRIPFIDLDDRIVKKAGKSIPAIFEEDGSVAFREIEASCLRELSNLENGKYIVACGGGTPCFFDNMEWMNSHGTTILLDVPPAVIAERLGSSDSQRPLTKDWDKEEILSFILPLLQQRNNIYLQAKHVIHYSDDILEQLKGIINYENP